MRLWAAVALISAAALGYEVLLVRLLSIVLWGPFAALIISLALLGYGASGAVLAGLRAWAGAPFAPLFAGAATLFALAAPGAFALVQALPFNPLEVIWDPAQWLYLGLIYLLLAVPFFAAATCLGVAYIRFGERVATIYRADLLGAGAGATLIVLALFVLRPEAALRVVGLIALAAGALIAAELGRRRLAAGASMVLAAAALALWPPQALTPRPSPYKALSQALEAPGTRVLAERSSPLGLLSVVDSPTIPFRDAPGLSLTSEAEVAPQLGIFVDGDAMTPIPQIGDLRQAAYLDDTPAAAAYALVDAPRVLVLGAGGGSDVWLARRHRARRIDAVELDGNLVELAAKDFAPVGGGAYGAPEVHVHVGEIRAYLARDERRYDLIHLAAAESFAAASTGLVALDQSALLTVEAITEVLRHLSADGVLSLSRWLKVPPRDSLKLALMARAALARLGVAEPAADIAVVAGWNTVTVLVRRQPFARRHLEALRDFAAARGFALAFPPPAAQAEASGTRPPASPSLEQALAAVLGGDRARFVADYKYALSPATDDRPFFAHFFRWRALPELIALRAGGGLSLVEWGYLIQFGALVQALVLSALLILLPALALARRQGDGARLSPLVVVVYFAAIGLAFLFVEIAFIHRFTLFLGHPLYGVAAALAGFLVAAGLGSGASPSLARRLGARTVPAVVAAFGLIALIYLGILPALLEAAASLPDLAKVPLALALIAPLGFLMGVPFPVALGGLAEGAPGYVPWAFGINGCASVLSALLANLLAVELGFRAVVVAAIALYAVAAASWRWGGGPAAPTASR